MVRVMSCGAQRRAPVQAQRGGHQPRLRQRWPDPQQGGPGPSPRGSRGSSGAGRGRRHHAGPQKRLPAFDHRGRGHRQRHLQQQRQQQRRQAQDDFHRAPGEQFHHAAKRPTQQARRRSRKGPGTANPTAMNSDARPPRISRAGTSPGQTRPAPANGRRTAPKSGRGCSWRARSATTTPGPAPARSTRRSAHCAPHGGAARCARAGPWRAVRIWSRCSTSSTEARLMRVMTASRASATVEAGESSG